MRSIKVFDIQEAKVFKQLANEIKTETSILRLETFCNKFKIEF